MTHVFRKDLSQWLTPRPVIHEVMNRFNADLSFDKVDSILDPATGDGRLCDVMPQHCHIVGVDLDASITEMSESKPWGELVTGVDFLSGYDAPEGTFGLAVTNPPYEGGKDLEFVVKCMRLSTRVIAILRSSFLHNKGTRSRVLRAPGWGLKTVLALGRVRFEGLAGSNGPRHDFIAIDLVEGFEGATTWERV